nr:metallophosphoesterase [Ruania zhangjianzhongii]
MSALPGRPLRRAAGVLAGAAAVGLTWSLVEAQAFTVRRVHVPVLPAGADPIRVLHLSDLHLLPRQGRKIGWLRDLEALEPDVVVNTGDNMAHREALPAVLAALEPLLQRPGVFVMGSNDYFSPKPSNPARYLLPDPRRRQDDEQGEERAEDLPGRELGYAFAACGWQDLTNQSGSLEVRGQRLDFIGVDDPHLDRDELPQAWPARAETGDSGTSVPAQEALRIGVAHAPYLRVLRGMQGLGCELVLAGHTHGGQLCLPGYGAVVTNCDLNTGRASGLHPWPGEAPGPGNLWLHVSNGMGTNPYTPVRLACRPSVTLMTLTAPSS